MRRIRRRALSELGSELIEFAIAVPVLLLLVAGLIDFGLMLRQYEVLTNAAREGARLALLPDYDQAAVQARVVDYLTAGGLTDAPTVTLQAEALATGTGGPTMSGVRVTVTYPHSFVIFSPVAQLFGRSPAQVDLRGVSVMRLPFAAGG